MFAIYYNVASICNTHLSAIHRETAISFWEKTNEIAKFDIVDEKTNFNPSDKNAKRIRKI